MFQNYINSAIRSATYELLPESNSIYGEIPLCRGVYAKAENFEKCREELIEILEEWIILRLRHNLEIPVIDNIDLNIKEQEINYASY
jgi:predicted RNase H-like HicB family nuclease